MGGPMAVAFLATGSIAKVGGLGGAMVAVTIVTTIIAAVMFIFCGPFYERARNEVRRLREREVTQLGFLASSK